MNKTQVLLAARDGLVCRQLAEALQESGVPTHPIALDASATLNVPSGRFALVLAPDTRSALMDWDEACSEIATCFALAQSFVKAAQCAAGMHLIFLVPADAAMGDQDSPSRSAMAGGIISLVRTLALELKKPGISVNTLAYSCAGGELAGAESLVAMIRSLADQTGAWITGQEIFACAGQDSGRLRP